MERTVLVLGMLAILAGCVVVPDNRVVEPAVMVYEPGIVYPIREQEYFWEPSLGLYFCVVNSDRKRHYMPHGWRYHIHGVPGHRHR